MAEEDGALTSLTFKFDENCVAPVGGTYKSEPTHSLCIDSTKNLTQVDFYINGGKIYELVSLSGEETINEIVENRHVKT